VFLFESPQKWCKDDFIRSNRAWPKKLLVILSQKSINNDDMDEMCCCLYIWMLAFLLMAFDTSGLLKLSIPLSSILLHMDPEIAKRESHRIHVMDDSMNGRMSYRKVPIEKKERGL